MDRYARLRQRTLAIDQAGLRRTLRPLQMTGPTTALRGDRPVVVFSSNDYLGLAQHPEMVAAWTGAGSGSARLIAGDRPAHHALEEALGERFGRPATLMSTGWHANLALLPTVLQAGDGVASDALNHASIIDALRLSRATRTILPHAQPQAIPADTRLVAVEGLYSMDGDTLPLQAYAGDHWLMVDEAHAVGALGPGGQGVAAAQGVQPDFLVGTLGKAYGAFGAFVVGPPELRALLLSQGRSFIFTTGLPEAAAHAALAGLRLATDARRQRLADRTHRLRQGLGQLGLQALGQHHIVPIVLGDQAMAVAAALDQAGFHVPGIRPPTVAPGQERIRITVSAAHTDAQIDGLLQALDGITLR